MIEQLATHSSGTFLEGVEWGEFQRKKPKIFRIRHGHYGVSLVELTFEGKAYHIALYTEALELDEAESVCQNVPEWWDASKDPAYLYDVNGNELWHSR